MRPSLETYIKSVAATAGLDTSLYGNNYGLMCQDIKVALNSRKIAIQDRVDELKRCTGDLVAANQRIHELEKEKAMNDHNPVIDTDNVGWVTVHCSCGWNSYHRNGEVAAMEDFSGHLAQVNHKETQEMADFAGVTEPKTLNAYEILRKRLIDTLEMQSDHDTEDDDIVKALQQSIEGFQFGLSNAEQRVDQLSAKLTAQRERIHDLERGISNYEEKNKFLANIFQGAEQKVSDQGKLIRDMNIHINKLESNARDSFAESEQIAKQNLALQTTIRAKDLLIAKLKELIPLL